MIILGISDIHGDISLIEKMSAEIADADIVLIVGDLTNLGNEKEAEQIVSSFRNKASIIMAVSGNCDCPGVDRFIEQEGLNIHGKGIVRDGIGFIGVGGSLATPFNTPNEITEDDLSRLLYKGLSEMPADVPMILVSHQPPFQTTCDMINTGEHVGSKTVRTFIEDHQPLVCFTGHIHESIAVDKIGRTHIINPGPFFSGRYAYAKVNQEADEFLIRKVR